MMLFVCLCGGARTGWSLAHCMAVDVVGAVVAGGPCNYYHSDNVLTVCV